MTLQVIDLLNSPTDPKSYRTIPQISGGVPQNWEDDVTGRLPAAIHAYYDAAPSDEDIKLVIAYCQHHIHAPCWMVNHNELPESDEEFKNDYLELCRLSLQLKTKDDIYEYILKSMEWGLDPL